MKLLILGGNGMAGHMIVNYFTKQGKHSVFYTTRNDKDPSGLMLDVMDMHKVDNLIEAVHPDAIINAIGVLNHHAEQDMIQAYYINGLLPHRLQTAADRISARLIHISTDCVFLGTRGQYGEGECPDGVTPYALTKALGEVRAAGHLTIRTSIIGPETRSNGIGLMSWFMKQHGEVLGYRCVLWNGITTLELAKAIEHLLDTDISGIIHLTASVPISKYNLLLLMKEIWEISHIHVIADDSFEQDRTLKATRSDMTYSIPSYRFMLEELATWMNM
ncbi:dTDP-4-dehydrorhamnose reductase [Paenibacillus sp. DS2015]|uniref:SDR family oxidoreductase n=1 Tax=Paenibacillus sp. DS2015 TaxID=3373917 RepID=UPI003D202FA0